MYANGQDRFRHGARTERAGGPPERPRNIAVKDSLKISLGALFFPVQTRRWRNFLHAHPLVDGLAVRFPKIVHKIYRPYLSRRLDCAARVDILIAHYSFLIDAGFSEMIACAARHPLPLAEFSGKSGSPFSLHLSAINDGHREGELTLILSFEGRWMYSATVVLTPSGPQRVLKLGSLQGARAPAAALQIKRATKDLFACRPKTLMVLLLRDMGAYFGCTTLQMVSNRNRVAINRRRGARISSDYDQTWQEMRALPCTDGDFALPCAGALDMDLADVPSRKRSEVRRRAALLAEIAASVRQSLEHAKGSNRRCSCSSAAGAGLGAPSAAARKQASA